MQDPGAGFTFFPFIVRFVELFTDMHVAQFFCLQGFVCPCLLVLVGCGVKVVEVKEMR